jgi:hypothetical protein
MALSGYEREVALGIGKTERKGTHVQALTVLGDSSVLLEGEGGVSPVGRQVQDIVNQFARERMQDQCEVMPNPEDVCDGRVVVG